MNRHTDPVDSALDLLRSDDWTAEPALKPIEDRIMQQMDRSRPRLQSQVFAMPRIAMLAVGAVVLGGVAFAATGGIETVKRWFVKIEINGRPTELALDENGVGATTIETEDGGQATIRVRKASTPDAGETTQVRVWKTAPGAEHEGVAEIVRRTGPPPAEIDATLADLGDASPLAQFDAADGTVKSVYILPATEGAGSRIFVRTDRKGEEPAVRLVGNTRHPIQVDGAKPEVTLDDDGTLTITLENGGEKRVMKFRTASHAGDDPAIRGPGEIRVDMPGGEIKVEVSEDDAPR